MDTFEIAFIVAINALALGISLGKKDMHIMYSILAFEGIGFFIWLMNMLSYHKF